MRHWTRKHGTIATVLGLLALIGAPPPLIVHAANWKVCPPGSVDPTCHFTDLQAAVNAAANGDTLTLTAGTHTAPSGVSITGKNLAIAGAGAHLTIVQPSASAQTSSTRVFTIGS
ncbi:MAG: hypothetical protein NZ518_08960, partial [Dehalococcoidia bacterium]|nr:hypothetical protein [Dehalococcoidia bacterium]